MKQVKASMVIKYFSALALLGGIAWATDEFALVGSYYGTVGFVGLDGTGSTTPVVNVNSPSELRYGSYGIGIGDFDNDGLDDYLIGGTGGNGSGPALIEFHKRTGPGAQDFAPGAAIDGAGGWLYYVMDFGVADYDHDGNLDFAVNDYNEQQVHVYRGHGDGTFQPLASFVLPFHAIGLDAADVNNDGNTDFVSNRYYDSSYYNYCYYATTCQASKKVAVFLGHGDGTFTETTQELTFTAGSNSSYYYYYNYSWGIALADYDGDGNVDAAVSDINPQANGNNVLLVFRGHGDGTFASEPIRTGPSLPGETYSYGALDNEDVNHDGIQDILFGGEHDQTIRTYLGVGDGTFTLSSTQRWTSGSQLTSLSTRPGDPASDRRAPTVRLDGLAPLTNVRELRVTGSAIDAGRIATAELVHDGVAQPIEVGTNGAVGATVSLSEGTNQFVLRATDRAGNVGESAPVTTILDTQLPTIELSALPQFTTEATFTITARVTDEHGLRGTVINLNGAQVAAVTPDTGGQLSAGVTLAPGTNTLEVVATDAAGNTRSEGGTVILDTAGPEVTLTALPQYTNRTAQTVSGTAIDDHGIDALVLSINGAVVGAPFHPDASGHFSVDVTLAEGANTVSVRALDLAGLAGAARLSTMLDTIPPTATLNPMARYTNVPTLAADGSAIDSGSGIESATLRVIGGATSGLLQPDASGLVAAMLALGEGPQTVVLEVRDRAGNLGATSGELTLDTIAPRIAIESPLEGQPFGDTRISVAADVVDATPTSVAMGGLEFHLAGAGSVGGVVEVAGEGPNVLELVARDAAGNVSTAHVSVVVDLTAPVADLDLGGIVDGAELGRQPGDQLLYTLHVDDLTQVTAGLSWGGSTTLPAGGGVLQGTAPLVEGRNVLAISLIDVLGHQTDLRRTVTYDVTGPQAQLTGVLATAASAVRGTVELSADATDNLTGVATGVFEIDGAQTSATANGSSFGAAIDTSALADGLHAVRATFTDRVGNSTTVAGSILVDNTAPQATIESPAASAYLRQSVSITASASDATSGIRQVEISVNGRSVGACAVSPCSVSFDTTTLANGAFLISVVARDAAGNSSVVAERSAIADNTAPSKFLVSPLSGATLGGSTTLVVNVIDDAFASVECFVDGVSLGASTDPTFSATIDLLAKLDGAVVVTCSARDLAGNVGTESATIRVKNWTLDLDPKTLNLKSNGNEVKLVVQGPNLNLLLPVGDKALSLVVTGGSPVPLVAKREGYTITDGRLELKFDRPTLVATIKAALAAGSISASAPVTVRFLSGSRELGSQTIRVEHAEAK